MSRAPRCNVFDEPCRHADGLRNVEAHSIHEGHSGG